MRSRLLHFLVRRSWWWVFGLFIAVPAVALALLGLGSLRADELEREKRLADQETQLIRLVDSALTTVLDRFVADAAGSLSSAQDGAPLTDAPDVMPFDIDRDGRLRFPVDRVMTSPGEHVVALSPATAALVDQARAADAQRRTADAVILYERLRGQPSLSDWADLQLTLLRSKTLDSSVAAAIVALRLEQSDSRSPSGIPLAMVAASIADLLAPLARTGLTPLLEGTLASLHNGRWWLTLDERRAYNNEVHRWLDSTVHHEKDRRDVRLDAISRAAPLVLHAAGSDSRSNDRAVALGRHDSRLLLVWTRSRDGSAGSNGVVVAGPHAHRAIAAALGPLFQDQPFAASLRGRQTLLWGKEPSASATAHPLTSLTGWTLSLTDTTPPATMVRRVLDYSRIILPIGVLAFGLLMTAWIVRREMALTELQSAFVAAVTHEFKSPLTSIRLLLERVTSGRIAAGHSPDRYFSAIGAETDRLESLVNRLLEAQKLQTGQREYRLRPTAIDAVVREVVERLRPQAEAKQIGVHVTIASDVPRLPLDVDSVSDAVANLVDNAIKYSPEGSHIQVAVECRGAEVQVSVSDEGIGVEPADATRIFEPFVRSRRGDHASVHGTGLGLSLVKATAEAHGGSVSVTSDGVRGSRFVLALGRGRAEAT